MTPDPLQSIEIDVVSLQEEMKSLKALVRLLSDTLYSYRSSLESMQKRVGECEIIASHAGAVYYAELKHLTNKVYRMWYELHPDELQADDF